MTDRLADVHRKVSDCLKRLKEGGAPIGTIVDAVERSLYDDLSIEASFEAGWESISMILIDTLCELRQLTNDLIARVNEQTPVLHELKAKVSHLEEKVRKLEGDQEKLIAGQLAFMVEKEVLAKVFANSKCPSPDELMLYSIKSMEKAINCKHPYNTTFTGEQHKLVSENWKMLKDKLGWTADHYVGVRELKEQRLGTAHPDVLLSEIQKILLKVTLSSKARKVCMDFVRFITELRKM